MAIPAASVAVSRGSDCPDDVISTMWRLLLPNSQARISAEFEFAQRCAIACRDSAGSSRRNGPEPHPPIPDSRLREILNVLNRFESSGRPWHLNPYDAWPHFLDGYLIYYSSRYALALEFVLLDLYRSRILPSSLTVFDVGVGPATATLAVLEFLRKLARACQAADVSFPIADIQLWFLDRSQKVLDYACKTLGFYLEALRSQPSEPALKRIGEGDGAQPRCIAHDLRQPLPSALACSPSLLVFANVVSDVLFVQKERDATLLDLIETLQPGGVVIILEHPVYAERLREWVDRCPALTKLDKADRQIRRRVQSFEPHDLFAHLITKTPALQPHAWRYANPLNDELSWIQAIYVKR